MTSNANTVNIKSTRAAYHHGDLRAAVIAEGLKLLESGAAEDLSLREIARNVGVSAPAIYRHFPDKDALLKALAREAAERLGAAQAAAAEKAGGGAAGFNATGRAYVRFAIDNPALFRLMMSSAPPQDWLRSGPADTDSAMSLLRRNVSSLAPPGASEEMRRTMAVRAWSMVHGLALLMLDGQIPVDYALIDRVIDGNGLNSRQP